MAVVEGFVDLDQDVLYDTQTYNSGDTKNTYFAQSVSGSTTYKTTNMLEARKLPSNEVFSIKGFECVAEMGIGAENLNLIYQNSWIVLTVNRVPRFILALRFIPSSAAMVGIDNRATGTDRLNYQWHAQGKIFSLVRAVKIHPNQTFDLSLETSPGQGVSVTVDLTFGLHGIRASRVETK